MARTLPRRPSLLSTPAPPAGLRVWCAGLVLLVSWSGVAAQPTPLPTERSLALPASRSELFVSPGAHEVSLRSRRLARAVQSPLNEGRAPQDLAHAKVSVWMYDGRAGGAQALAGAVPATTLGLGQRRLQEPMLPAAAAPAHARAHGLMDSPANLNRGTKVGLEWRPAKSAFGLEQGALGFQMESGYKLSMKVRHGRPSLYLRGQF